MSTRASIVIQDKFEKAYFYRHSDGYPEVTFYDLLKFVKGYRENMRLNTMQSAGWLIVHGHNNLVRQGMPDIYDWKVGDYEPASGISDWAEYIYEIDLENRELRAFSVDKKERILKEKF